MSTSSLRLRAITFGGAYNLPAWVAQRNGYFARHGLDVEIAYTPDSAYLMTRLIDGDFDVAMTAIDNLIAYQEGQGEAPTKRKPDLAAFMGVDSGFLELVAVPGTASIADLRGTDVAVDALTTGFAFVLREMLERGGLAEGDVNFVREGGSPARLRGLLERKFSATLLPTPFALQAAERGHVILGSGKKLLGRYQGRSAFADRGFIERNAHAVIAYIRAYRDAMAWIFDPEHRDSAEEVLIAHDRGLTPALARRTYDLFTDRDEGLFRDLAVDVEGVRVVLELRNKFGSPPEPLRDPHRYIVTDCHTKALEPASETRTQGRP